MDIDRIYIRDSEAAFDNAASKGFDCKDTHMYMYTKFYKGYNWDVFKNILTRRHETVEIGEWT